MTPAPPSRRVLFDHALVRDNGIARRLMVALILFSTAITALITAGELYLDYRVDVRGIDDRIESIRKVFLPTLTESVWVAEKGQIQVQLDGLLNLGDIEYVGVEVDGKTAWAAGMRRSARQIERTMPLSRTYRGQPVHIGDLHVVASVDNVIGRLWSKLLVILVSNTIKTLLVTAFVLLIFQFMVGQHLEHISGHLRTVGKDIQAADDLALRRHPGGRWRPDALDHVTTAVNTMQRDIRASQREIRELNQALEARVEERTRQLNAAKDAAEVANTAKSQFLSRMSHELRTPLNSILGFSDVLLLDERYPLRPEQHQRLERIANAGRHLLLLINDLLDISRIETGSMQLRIENVDLRAVIFDVVRDLRAVADESAVSVVVETLAADAGTVRADGTRLRQVMFNLVSNAIKYNRSQGSVRLVAERAGAAVRVTVHDTGIGLDEQQLQALFQPFNRLGREASNVEGTGIGLVITQSLVAMMGSELAVRSQPGLGSEFAFDLPVGDAAAAMVADEPVQPGGFALRPDVCGRVLYIDDDPVNRVLMQAFFEMRPGVELRLAEDGRSGIAAATTWQPDLVLVDMVMPDMSGIQVLRALRTDPALHDVPCVAVSANAMPQEMAEALQAGFDAYLTKPLSAAGLLAEVDRRL